MVKETHVYQTRAPSRDEFENMVKDINRAWVSSNAKSAWHPMFQNPKPNPDQWNILSTINPTYDILILCSSLNNWYHKLPLTLSTLPLLLILFDFNSSKMTEIILFQNGSYHFFAIPLENWWFFKLQSQVAIVFNSPRL